MSAGAISGALHVRPNTLSTHLGVLSQSGLVSSERDGRSIHYRADLGTMQFLVTYLLQDCCGGNPELCAPIINMATQACTEDGCC